MLPYIRRGKNRTKLRKVEKILTYFLENVSNIAEKSLKSNFLKFVKVNYCKIKKKLKNSNFVPFLLVFFAVEIKLNFV